MVPILRVVRGTSTPLPLPHVPITSHENKPVQMTAARLAGNVDESLL
jgi:hypothetical protein